jgi:cytoskeletal protein CcmA (bactofilin family)
VARSLLLVGLLLALALPATAQARDQIVITGDVVVGEDQTFGDVVIVDGPVRVDGRVTGDVIAISGTVTVSGRVDGDVAAVDERVRLLSGARVGGDVLHGGPRPEIAADAVVEGEVLEEGWTDISTTGLEWIVRFLFWLAVTASTFVLGLGLVLLIPRAADAAWRVASQRTGIAAAWAAGLFFGLPIAAVLAIATAFGLPLGIAVLLALVPLAMIGYVTSCVLLGGVVLRKSPGSRVKAFFIGWGILRLVALVPYLGILAWVLASAFGLGVLLIAGWYAGRDRPPATPTPTPAT